MSPAQNRGVPEEGDAVPWAEQDHARMSREIGAERAAHERSATEALARILGVVWRLRDPDGCPWDRDQTLSSMSANLTEEACETAEAIAQDDDRHVAEELGDTLMNVLLMARIAEQEGRFDIATVAGGIAEKLVRRHPHVFGDVSAEDADAALVSWNATKAAERERGSVLDGIPSGLPALAAAHAIGKAAAGVGFDWPDATGALDKLEEERRELAEACARRAAGGSLEHIEDELGDVLFAAVNVARKAGLDPELALRRTIAKFRRRFAVVEQALGDRLRSASLQQMEALWREAARADASPE